MIGPYIYDFVCFEKKLIVELDGSQHTEQEVIIKDKAKEDFAKNLGYKVLRYNNNDAENNIEGVLKHLRLNM